MKTHKRNTQYWNNAGMAVPECKTGAYPDAWRHLITDGCIRNVNCKSCINKYILETPLMIMRIHLRTAATLEQGQFDDLKLETSKYRVWVSRMTTEDGASVDNKVTIEKLVKGTWKVLDRKGVKS